MVGALEVSASMKQEMTERMFLEYNDWRTACIEAAGECSLQELRHEHEIWSTVCELSIFVDRDSTCITFSFLLELDPDHEITVTYRDGVLDEVMIEG